LSDSYDAIVIGSGLGGLVAGALSARRGKRVLVLEKNASFGGAVGVYERGPLTIESSLHELDGLDAGDPKLPILRALGIDSGFGFVDVGGLYEVRSPLLGEPFDMPSGLEAAISATSARFPTAEGVLRDYFKRLTDIHELARLALEKRNQRLWWVLNGPLLPRRFLPLARHLRRSLGEVLQRLFGADEAVQLVLAANLQYYADDPDRLWFPFYSMAQGSFHVGGAHYLRGGSQRLADHLLSLITAAGGAAEPGRRATRILLADGRAAGVEHAPVRGNGGALRASAPVVFGNAAPPALAEMLPAEGRTAFLSPYAKRSPSAALWTLALGFTRRPRELGVREYTTWIYPDWMRSLGDVRRSAQLLAEPPGSRLPHYGFGDYSAIDSGLPGPPYFGLVTGTDSIDNWRGLSRGQYEDRTARWTDAMIGALDDQFPGIASTVEHRSLSTARSVHDYLGTPGGSIYGFAPEPPRARFFWPRTKVKGLLLASAYGGIGGYSGAILTGAEAVRAARWPGPHLEHLRT
jgi:all-trans-retinol 13,14-reductase